MNGVEQSFRCCSYIAILQNILLKTEQTVTVIGIFS